MDRNKILITVFGLFATLLCAQQPHLQVCQLTIHVRASDDRDLGRQVQIELLSPSGTPVGTAQTNDDGTAYFQVSSGVTYRALISGKNIESTSSDFFIMGGQQNHTENLTVKRIASSRITSPNGSRTVSVSEANVPESAKAEMQKGVEAFDRGDLDQARQKFEKAVSIYPRYARAYGNLGIIALKSKDRKAAREFFSKATHADDTYLPGYIGLARMEVQDKNYTGAESLLAKVLLLNPGMPEAVALLASAEYGNKEYEKALADAQRVHTMPEHQQFANAHLLAAQILEMQNREQEAIAEYKAFLSESPTSPQAPAVQKAIADLEAAVHPSK
jgi:tetratricopeptide (TPR) repeat protein